MVVINLTESLESTGYKLLARSEVNISTHEYSIYSTNPQSARCRASVLMLCPALTCETLPIVTSSAARFKKLAGTNPTESVFSALTTHQDTCSSLLRTFRKNI
jgi:hypothetical protein